jgi:hypothetical protein
MSMIGSGIYSETVTREIVCDERCEECLSEENATPCDHYWDQDFETDDRGNVDCDVTCPKCNHTYGYSEEA